MTARYPLVLNGTTIQELQTGDTVAGMAASGANSDITSLTGLTTALSVAQGGTGATSASAALTALGAQAALSNASATVSGILTSTDWNTFNSKQAALGTASASVSGYLTSTDWNTFNSKQAALVSATNIKTVNGTTLLGSGDLVISGGASATKTIANITAAYTVVAGDLGKIINCTSGTFTISLTAAATLGSGFTCTIWNTSNTATAAITISPATGTIDGVATLILRRGEGLDIVCDGTNWQINNKKPMRGYTENMGQTIGRSTSTGNVSMALGNSATASGEGAYAFGHLSNAGASASFALGHNSGFNGSVTATGAGAMALGGSYASGTDSFAAGIGNNTSSYGATGTNSVAIGPQASAYSSYSVAIGWGAQAGNRSVVIGGYASTAGDNSAAIGSYSSVINGPYSATLGGGCASDRGQHNRQAFGTIGALGVGTAQTGHFIFVANTTDATTTTLTSTGSTGSPAYIMLMTNQCAYSFIGTVVAKRQGTTNASAWKVEGMIVRGASEATTTLVVGTVTAISNANGWSLTLVADTTYGGLLIRGTGQAGVNIRWVAAINSAEVVYA
jgi:hypothetical protein